MGRAPQAREAVLTDARASYPGRRSPFAFSRVPVPEEHQAERCRRPPAGGPGGREVPISLADPDGIPYNAAASLTGRVMMMWLWDGDEPGDRDRIDFITDELAVTDLTAASNLDALTRHGIRAVVDASNREGNPRFPGIRYYNVPIADPDERFAEFLPGVVAFIDEARRRGPVLLHCMAGISRSPALAVCYLHERHGMSLPAALHHIRSRRAYAAPHPLFLQLIEEYYRARIVPAPVQLAAAGNHHSAQDSADGHREER